MGFSGVTRLATKSAIFLKGSDTVSPTLAKKPEAFSLGFQPWMARLAPATVGPKSIAIGLLLPSEPPGRPHRAPYPASRWPSASSAS
jgi:hypothetical protein